MEISQGARDFPHISCGTAPYCLPVTALADEAAAFQKGQFLLFYLKAAVLVFLCEKPTGGDDFRRVFRFWRIRLSERR
jgi:hypothetical protein